MRRGPNGCFDVIVGRDKQGHVVTWHQFSTLPLKQQRETLSFLQYTTVADDAFMRQEHGEAFGLRQKGILTANYNVMAQVAEENGRVLNCEKGHRGTIFESEMKGQGSDEESIRFTEKRLKIHGATGAKAIMLQMPDGSLVTPHMQPSLGEDAEAIKLLLMFRPAKYNADKLDQIDPMDIKDAYAAAMAFINNFDTEGFDAKDVQEARDEVEGLFKKAQKAVLYPPTQVPDVHTLAKSDPKLAEFLQRDYGDLGDHEKLAQLALSRKVPTEERHRGS
jgi:hypothetical protein